MSRSNHARRPKVRRGHLPAESEAAWEQKVVQLAGYCGWTLRYHTHDSRRSAPGFPDWILVHERARELIVVELKSEVGRVRPEQGVWMQALAACGLEVHLWRPSDWPAVQERLTKPREGGPDG